MALVGDGCHQRSGRPVVQPVNAQEQSVIDSTRSPSGTIEPVCRFAPTGDRLARNTRRCGACRDAALAEIKGCLSRVEAFVGGGAGALDRSRTSEPVRLLSLSIRGSPHLSRQTSVSPSTLPPAPRRHRRCVNTENLSVWSELLCVQDRTDFPCIGVISTIFLLAPLSPPPLGFDLRRLRLYRFSPRAVPLTRPRTITHRLQHAPSSGPR